LGKCIDIIASMNGISDYPLHKKVKLNEEIDCYLRLTVKYDKLKFYYSENGKDWNPIGPIFDASTLSDEFEEGGGDAHFTGAFVGLCCQDLTKSREVADFDYFEYLEWKK
jgi:xylan 1,4-beta-xylosidase